MKIGIYIFLYYIILYYIVIIYYFFAHTEMVVQISWRDNYDK